jgi:murein L,D-transpeptidase YcbB/YkuD
MAFAFIQGTMRAEKATVEAYKKVNKAFGGRLRISSPDGANRTRAAQQKLYNLFLSGRGATAAVPGTSNHEGGRALDIWNFASFPTLRQVMAEHGFTRDASEQWHYNYRGATSVASSNTVSAIQTLLNKFGYKLAVDGIQGPKTRAATLAFQKKQGLAVDGIVGPLTLAKLNAGTTAPKAKTSSTIRAVQQKLRTSYPLYASRLAVDGINGPNTKAAVREFQRRSGIVVDGIAGPVTRKLLGV